MSITLECLSYSLVFKDAFWFIYKAIKPDMHFLRAINEDLATNNESRWLVSQRVGHPNV